MRSLHSLLLPLPIAAAALAAVASCSNSDNKSEEQQSTVKEVTPKDYFLQNVYPRMAGTGSCGGCHAGPPSPCSQNTCQFVGADGPLTYSLIERRVGYIAAPQKSTLLQYTHKDQTDLRTRLTNDQSNVLGIWLGMEANARNLPGAVPKAKSLQEAYAQFARCMSLENFNLAGLNYLPFAQTDLDGPCIGCHSNGQAGIWLSANPQLTFEKLREFPYIQKFVVGRVDSEGKFKELVPAGRLIDKANEPCPPGADSCHPQYGLSDTMKSGIQTFINITLQNQAAGTCDTGLITKEDAGIVNLDGGK